MEQKEKIEKRCNVILDCLQQMEEVLPDNSEEYNKNHIYQNASERLVERIVDSSTDIIAIMCNLQNVTSTSILDFSTMVKALEHKGIFTKKIAENLVDLYGFKNRILYNYGENEKTAAYEILVGEFFPFYQEFVDFVDKEILKKEIGP